MVTTLCAVGNIWPGFSSQTGTMKKSSVLMLARVQAQLENALRQRSTPAPTVTTVPPRPPSLQVDEPKAYLPSWPWPMIYSTPPRPGPWYPVPTTYYYVRGARFMTHLFLFTVSACQVCPTSMRPTNWVRAYLAGLALFHARGRLPMRPTWSQRVSRVSPVCRPFVASHYQLPVNTFSRTSF